MMSQNGRIGWLTLLWFILLTAVTSSKKNVLFLVSDDMRPELGCYLGPDFPTPTHPKIHSPNLDKLASKSLLLKKAYVQQAVCAPSRASLLTGRRPDTTHVYWFDVYWRKSAGNFTTIPQHFKNNGYTSIGMGKVFHPGDSSGYDDPISWSEPYFHAPNLAMYNEMDTSWLPVPKLVREKLPLPDEQLKDHAIETLKNLAPKARTGEKPFFLAVGFHKPHLPFVFPAEFLELYPNISLPANPYAPVNMPSIAWWNYFDLRDYHDIGSLRKGGEINSTLPDSNVIDLRRAYYSALSFTDSLIGEVMAALDELGLSNNTIVSFWGDHGWQLGEHGEWEKETNFEIATHAPMMVRIPGLTDNGIVTESLTEFVDLFPTLAEAAGIPTVPMCPKNSSQIELCSEGVSLMPLIKDPQREWKKAAFSQHIRWADEKKTKIMGYTMKTDKYRYTEWPLFHDGPSSYEPVWSKLYGAELYDHRIDPEENVNRADMDEYKEIRKELSKQLRVGWRTALPPM